MLNIRPGPGPALSNFSSPQTLLAPPRGRIRCIIYDAKWGAAATATIVATTATPLMLPLLQFCESRGSCQRLRDSRLEF
ncbi:hypothetical protein ACLKA7_009668 [Drosophila subpalustris]